MGKAPLQGSARRYRITICTKCGALTTDDRDYGGPFPANSEDCAETPICGSLLPPREMPAGRDAFGAKACPGERTITVAEVHGEADG